MCLTGGGCASEGCRSKYVIVRALLQFVNRPNGLLWIVFKKETHKLAVDDYVSRLDKAEYVYSCTCCTASPPMRRMCCRAKESSATRTCTCCCAREVEFCKAA